MPYSWLEYGIKIGSQDAPVLPAAGTGLRWGKTNPSQYEKTHDKYFCGLHFSLPEKNFLVIQT
jgi:hypothetical protein